MAVLCERDYFSISVQYIKGSSSSIFPTQNKGIIKQQMMCYFEEINKTLRQQKYNVLNSFGEVHGLTLLDTLS
jgi:hypothetical protein